MIFEFDNVANVDNVDATPINTGNNINGIRGNKIFSYFILDKFHAIIVIV